MSAPVPQDPSRSAQWQGHEGSQALNESPTAGVAYTKLWSNLSCQISVIAESVSPSIAVSWLVDICCCDWISLP